MALVLLIGCGPAEEPLARAREAVAEALRRADRAAAVQAIAELRRHTPDTAEAHIEVATLLARAGAAPEALWLLEREYPRFPESEWLRVALAEIALSVANPSLARQVLSGFPPDSAHGARVMLITAQAELQLGNLERGLEIMKEAERRHPERAEVHLARIAALRREHRHEEARQALEAARTALAGHEDLVKSRHLDVTLAQIQAAQGEAAAAIEHLQALAKEDPANLHVWNALIQLLTREGRAAEVAPLLESAVSGDSIPVELQTQLARSYVVSGRFEDAERVLLARLQTSRSPASFRLLAVFYTERGHHERALEVARESIEAFPRELLLRVLLIETLLVVERVDDARIEVERLTREFAADGSHPDSPYVEYLRARVELAEGDAPRAAQRLARVLPMLDRAATQFWLGAALEAQGDYRGAERRYALAWRRDASWLHAPLALIRLDRRRGDWKALAAHGRRLTRQAPGLFEGWAALAEALLHLGEPGAAEQSAARLVASFPDRPEPLVLLARALRAQGQREEALLTLSEAIDARPTPLLEAEHALMLGMNGRIGEGLAELRDALERNPESAELHGAFASLSFAADEAEAGDKAVDRARELDPSEPSPLRTRCEYREATGRLAGALEDCQRYLAARPHDSRAFYVLGLAQARLGESEAAIESYRRAIELDPGDYRARNNLAELLVARGDLDGALAEAQEAYRLAEQNPYVLDTLGHLYLRKGLVGRATLLLEASHAMAPDVPDHSLHLAMAYHEAGRSEDARRLLENLQRQPRLDPQLRARVEGALDSVP